MYTASMSPAESERQEAASKANARDEENTGETSWFRNPRLDRSRSRTRSGSGTERSRRGASAVSSAPDEDAASRVDVARRAAREHLQARRQILALRAERGSGSSTPDEGSTWLLNWFRRSNRNRDRSSNASSVTQDLTAGAPVALHRGPNYDGGKRQERVDTILSQAARQDTTDDALKAATHDATLGSDSEGQDRDEHDDDGEEEESALSAAFLISYFVAGGAAGAASRTVVSPLERLKIIMQVQPKSASNAGKGAYSGVISGLHKMWQEEGFKGYMRGNGINCLRIAPYSAVQFSTYEIVKTYLVDEEGELDVPRRLFAGAMAGIASVVSTYPLDLVRSRISIASASMYAEAKNKVADASKAAESAEASASAANASPAPHKPTREEVRRIIEERQKKIPGISAMTAKVYREEGGIRALYKGCVPTSLGVAPYVGINFAAYEALRKKLADEEGEISTLRKLCCGALAGSISQTLTYPLDVLRRRMQVSGMKDSKLGYSDKSAWGAIRTIVTREGFFGLYRGIVPNLLKVAPSIGTSFAVYEFVQNQVHPHHDHHHHHHNNHHEQQESQQDDGQGKNETSSHH